MGEELDVLLCARWEHTKKDICRERKKNIQVIQGNSRMFKPREAGADVLRRQ